MASSLIENLVNTALKMASPDLWTSLHAEDDDESADEFDTGFVMV